MNNTKITKITNSGFIAMIAVILLSAGAMAFSIGNMASVMLYADSVNKHVSRVQKSLDYEFCLDKYRIKKSKNYFLNMDNDDIYAKCSEKNQKQ